MNKTKFYFSIIALIWVSSAKCQFYQYINLGVKTGINYSEISNVPEIFEQEAYSNLVYLDTKAQVGAQFGAFLNYRFQSTILGFQSELYYSQEHSVSERKVDGELQYSMDFKFNYLQLNTLLKYYPAKGFNIGLGPQVGFNLTPENIVFKDEIYPETQLNKQQAIRNSVRGRTNFQILASIGYEFENGLTLDARYAAGLADVIETNPNNSFNWIENTNHNSSIQISIGYGFGVSTY